MLQQAEPAANRHGNSSGVGDHTSFTRTDAARAEMHLAEQYDAAQEQGEVVGAHDGAKKRVGGDNAFTSADIGLRSDEIHDARKLRALALVNTTPTRGLGHAHSIP